MRKLLPKPVPLTYAEQEGLLTSWRSC